MHEYNQISNNKIQSFETKCYRKVLRTSVTEKRKNIDNPQDLNIEEYCLINKSVS
uniref:Uncharacterized protein n=1 Tax=Arion vulgaris TaxID=1028688 RepID=A0A0B7AX51_9EUPU